MRIVVLTKAAASTQASEMLAPQLAFDWRAVGAAFSFELPLPYQTASLTTTSLSWHFACLQLPQPKDSQFVGPQPRLLSWLPGALHTAAGVLRNGAQQGMSMQVQCISPVQQVSSHTALAQFRGAWPNTSLKLSANGVSRWPSSAGPAAHFALAVQRATPLAPA